MLVKCFEDPFGSLHSSSSRSITPTVSASMRSVKRAAWFCSIMLVHMTYSWGCWIACISLLLIPAPSYPCIFPFLSVYCALSFLYIAFHYVLFTFCLPLFPSHFTPYQCNLDSLHTVLQPAPDPLSCIILVPAINSKLNTIYVLYTRHLHNYHYVSSIHVYAHNCLLCSSRDNQTTTL